MNTNQARAYEEIDAGQTDWLNAVTQLETKASEPAPEPAWAGEADEANGVIRLRLCLRDRTPPEADAGKSGGRKRTKRAPTEQAEDRGPPPRPRIVWRREDEAETRPAPTIIME